MYKTCQICGATLDPGERCECARVDIGFCQASYRDAKDPEEQITILSELFSVSKETIIAVLGNHYTPKKKAAVKKGGSKRAEKEILKAKLRADIACGYSVADAARRRGVSYAVAATHTKNIRKELKEKLKAAKGDPMLELLQ